MMVERSANRVALRRSHPVQIVMLTALMASTMTTGVKAAEKQSRKQPNIVLILVDDMGWGDLRIHGNRNLVRAPKDKLIIAELSDYIVIDEGDVLLIYPRDKEQEIKSLRNALSETKYI